MKTTMKTIRFTCGFRHHAEGSIREMDADEADLLILRGFAEDAEENGAEENEAAGQANPPKKPAGKIPPKKLTPEASK